MASGSSAPSLAFGHWFIQVSLLASHDPLPLIPFRTFSPLQEQIIKMSRSNSDDSTDWIERQAYTYDEASVRSVVTDPFSDRHRASNLSVSSSDYHSLLSSTNGQQRPRSSKKRSGTTRSTTTSASSSSRARDSPGRQSSHAESDPFLDRYGVDVSVTSSDFYSLLETESSTSRVSRGSTSQSSGRRVAGASSKTREPTQATSQGPSNETTASKLPTSCSTTDAPTTEGDIPLSTDAHFLVFKDEVLIRRVAAQAFASISVELVGGGQFKLKTTDKYNDQVRALDKLVKTNVAVSSSTNYRLVQEKGVLSVFTPNGTTVDIPVPSVAGIVIKSAEGGQVVTDRQKWGSASDTGSVSLKLSLLLVGSDTSSPHQPSGSITISTPHSSRVEPVEGLGGQVLKVKLHAKGNISITKEGVAPTLRGAPTSSSQVASTAAPVPLPQTSSDTQVSNVSTTVCNPLFKTYSR